MTNNSRTALYVGFTGKALIQRVWEHKQKLVESFTKRYNINKLVYCEVFDDPISAIAREKQLKAGPRQKKIELVQHTNPEWKDLYDDLI